MNTVLRRATAADAAALLPLYLDFFHEDAIPTPARAVAANLAVMLDDPRAAHWLIEEDGRVIALAAGALTFGVEYGLSAELEDLYVTPAARGRGLARLLAHAVIDWARDQGATEMVLVITPQAEAEQGLTAFYEKLGFGPSPRITLSRTTG
ncbi:GNAT family N-acetyltransferase [Pseudooceanicola sp. 200-1SW]|uniref:GNAT family N-acetyltransferase n=1 Tax=Pseudooceanicola sp. 200-1SW TaxID=3425949 RepID=UPI003D7FD911